MHRNKFPRTVWHPQVPGGVLLRSAADCTGLENSIGVNGWVDSPDQLPARAVVSQVRPPRAVHEVMASQGVNEQVARGIVAAEARRFQAAQTPTTTLTAATGSTTIAVGGKPSGPVLRVDSERPEALAFEKAITGAQ